MKILDSNEPSLLSSKSNVLKKSIGNGAQIQLSFHARFLEVLKSSRSASEAPKADRAPVEKAPVEAPRAETPEPVEAEKFAEPPPSRSADDGADVAYSAQPYEAAPAAATKEEATPKHATPEETPVETATEEAVEKTTASEEAEKIVASAASEVLATLAPIAAPVEIETEAAEAEGVETKEVREVRFEAHVKLSRALTKEELEDLRASLRGIAKKMDDRPVEAAADFVAVVEELVGRPEIAKTALALAPQAEPKDLLAEGDGHLRRLLAQFEKFVRKALDRGEKEDRNEARREAAEIRAEIRSERKEAAAGEEKAARIVERVIHEIPARRRIASQAATQDRKGAETASAAVEEAPKSEIHKSERILPKRALEQQRRADEETPRRAEQQASTASAVRIAAASSEVVVLADRKPAPRAEHRENPAVQISIKTEGISEARSGNSNPSPFWQNAYDHSSKRADSASAKTGPAANPVVLPKEEIFSQIVQSARITLTDGKGEARLQLKPEHLGKVEIVVTTEDGKAQVQVKAESLHVTRLLADNLAELKQSLEAAGLEVGHLDVQLGQGDLREHDEAARENGRNRYGSAAGSAQTAEEDGDIVSLAWAAIGRREFVA